MTLGIEQIRAAAGRLAGKAIRTPLLRNAVLDEVTGGRIFLKPESLQHIGAFKFRGAYNRLSQLDGSQRQAGVVAFSSGNHAQGIAYAARLLGMPATIVMPKDAPQIKIDGTRKYGAEIRFYDRRTDSREAISAEIAAATGAVIVPAFDDLDIMAGQGTCGLEIVEQMAQAGAKPDLVMTPIGGGGLMAGVSTAVKAMVPGATLVGVEPEAFDDHRRSALSGQRESVDIRGEMLCDALLAAAPGELTWEVNRRTVSEFVVVSDTEVRQAVAWAFRWLKLVVEPGGVVALAALLNGRVDARDRDVAIVLSGGNVDPAVFCQCLQSGGS